MKLLVIRPVFVPEVIGAEGAELAPRVAMSLFPPGSGFFERGFEMCLWPLSFRCTCGSRGVGRLEGFEFSVRGIVLGQPAVDQKIKGKFRWIDGCDDGLASGGVVLGEHGRACAELEEEREGGEADEGCEPGLRRYFH